MDRRSFIGATALAAGSTALLAACGNDEAEPVEISSELPTEDVSITVWSWDGTVQAAAEAFMKENPNITIDVVNAGSSYDEYQGLDNAIQAGKGIPDLAMFEYFALPYFSVPGNLAPITSAVSEDVRANFVEAALNNVQIDGEIYGLPADYGPAAMFWNTEVFAEAGITEAPTTWDAYYEAAKAIRELGESSYIMNDGGDIFLLQSLIWQAGGRPFTVDGLDVTIDFTQPETVKAVEFWQKMLDEDLVTRSFAGWSDDWNRTLNSGELASQLIGGWFTSTLPERAPDQEGSFRVAPLPQWEEGQNVGSENGGSCFAIPAGAPNPSVAYAFMEFFTSGPGATIRATDGGAFVPAQSVLADDEFVSDTNPYFGDDPYRKTLVDIASTVGPDWSYPPFFEWARNEYEDIAIGFYTNGEGDLQSVLETWKERMVEYGNQQGFNVS